MAEFLGWEKASSALLVLGSVSSQQRRLAGTGWRHRQDNPELNHQQGTVSTFHTLCPIKAFLCPEYLQTDVSNTPELCSWSEQAPPGQLNTTGSSQEPVQCCCSSAPPGKHLPLLQPTLPPVRSHHRAARGWQQQGKGWAQEEQHKSWCHHPHEPWPRTRSPGPLRKHKPAQQWDPNLLTHIWAPLERASLQGKPDVQG